MLTFFWQRALLFFGLAVALMACSAGPQITRTQDVSESADKPYKKILVITLLSSFDSRRNLEKEVVQQLSELGTVAVASTSMMNSKTPVTRQTFVAMADKVDADAVLVTRVVSLESKGDHEGHESSGDSQYQGDRLLQCVERRIRGVRRTAGRGVQAFACPGDSALLCSHPGASLGDRVKVQDCAGGWPSRVLPDHCGRGKSDDCISVEGWIDRSVALLQSDGVSV